MRSCCLRWAFRGCCRIAIAFELPVCSLLIMLDPASSTERTGSPWDYGFTLRVVGPRSDPERQGYCSISRDVRWCWAGFHSLEKPTKSASTNPFLTDERAARILGKVARKMNVMHEGRPEGDDRYKSNP